VGLNIARVQYWLAVGAQPTKTVARILGQAAVIPKPPAPQSQQTGPKKEQKKR
jgi:small subunit ribosomal protein S16